MSKRTLYLLGILAAILAGTFLYPKFCCKDCCKKTAESTLSTTKNKTVSGYNFKRTVNGIAAEKIENTSKGPDESITAILHPKAKQKTEEQS